MKCKFPISVLGTLNLNINLNEYHDIEYKFDVKNRY